MAIEVSDYFKAGRCVNLVENLRRLASGAPVYVGTHRPPDTARSWIDWTASFAEHALKML